MMDDDVLLPDRGEAIAAEIANALGEARVIGSEDQVGAFVDDQLPGVVEPEKPVGGKHVARRDIELLHQKAAKSAGSSVGIVASTASRMTCPRRRRFSAVS